MKMNVIAKQNSSFHTNEEKKKKWGKGMFCLQKINILGRDLIETDTQKCLLYFSMKE